MLGVCLVLSLYCCEEVDEWPGHADGDVKESGLRGHPPEGPPLPLLDAFLSQTSSSAWPTQLPDVSCLRQLASSLFRYFLILHFLCNPLCMLLLLFLSSHLHVWPSCAGYCPQC